MRVTEEKKQEKTLINNVRINILSNFYDKTVSGFQPDLLKILLLFVLCFCSIESIYSQEYLKDIVQQIQIKTQHQHEKIYSLSFKGRSKKYFYSGSKAFGMNLVPESEEYLFEGFWIKPDSLRIQITAVRKTAANHPLYMNTEFAKPDYLNTINKSIPLPNPFQFSYDASTMGMSEGTRIDETGEKVSSWPVFPFSTGADSLYNYEIGSTVKFGSTGTNMRNIIEIIVTPKHPHVPAVSGTFQIDAEEKAVAGSDIVFNDAARFLQPGNKNDFETKLNKSYVPVNIREDYRKKTNNVLINSTFWLPRIIEEEYMVELVGFKIKEHRIIEFTSYDINPELPDTLTLANEKLTYKRDPELEKILFKGLENPHEMTKEEMEQIVNQIENSSSSKNLNSELFDLESVAQEAMKMRFGNKSSKYFHIAQRMGDVIHYNRVEGLRLDYGLSFSNVLLNKTVLAFNGGYGFENKRLKGGIAGLYFLNNKKSFFIEGNLYNTITFNESLSLFSNGKNSFSSLFFKADYRDYYYKNGGNFGLGILATDNLALKIFGVNHYEENAENHARFSIFRRNVLFRSNPEIMEGKFLGLRGILLYRTNTLNAELLTEYSDKKTLQSDFSFAFAQANFRWNYTIDQLNTLFLSFSTAFSRGKLPPQRWFDFGGKSLFNYNGNLRGVEYKAFTGDRMAYGTVEYIRYGGHYSGVSKKSSLLDSFKKMIKYTLWSGFGWSELSGANKAYAAGIQTPNTTTDGLYHELGISFGDKMNLLRLDLIRNSIDKNKIIFSVNIFK